MGESSVHCSLSFSCRHRYPSLLLIRDSLFPLLILPQPLGPPPPILGPRTPITFYNQQPTFATPSPFHSTPIKKTKRSDLRVQKKEPSILHQLLQSNHTTEPPPPFDLHWMCLTATTPKPKPSTDYLIPFDPTATRTHTKTQTTSSPENLAPYTTLLPFHPIVHLANLRRPSTSSDHHIEPRNFQLLSTVSHRQHTGCFESHYLIRRTKSRSTLPTTKRSATTRADLECPNKDPLLAICLSHVAEE